MAFGFESDARFILANQHQSGAYVASPAYSQYPYCWLRDGSFIAHAMDVVGESASARAFHLWTARAIRAIEPSIRFAIASKKAGRVVDHSAMPPARFMLDGQREESDWPNFQVDGYGQWLWSLTAHARAFPSEGLPAEVLHVAELVADYLATHWDEPCYDAWEEGRTQLHTSTLASGVAGLKAAASLLDASYEANAETAWKFIRDRCVAEGRFVKRVGGHSVDASLLWMGTPFGLISEDDPTFAATVDEVERQLVSDGGVRRYPGDTFYGGGAWPLLTAWLAWHHARNGRPERGRRYLTWIDRQRDANGWLPEQVATSHSDEWFLDWWTNRWGPSAHPLLWSHAMVMLALAEMDGVR